MTAAALAAVSFSVVHFANAQVEVVDLDVSTTRPSNVQRNSGNSTDFSPHASKPSPASMTEFYFQLQTLQEEVQTLRGIVEEQSYELKKLKQQRLDDYLDLDRRVSALSQVGAIGVSSKPTPTAALKPAVAAEQDFAASDEAAGRAEDELILYRTGIDAVLKQRDYEKGIASFESYLEQFPNGVYAANAKYWLGQVYLQRDELDGAQKWFSELVEEYPDHQKTAEAKFKLAKVLYLQGDLETAKQQLLSVASSGSSAAKLAQAFLDKNF